MGYILSDDTGQVIFRCDAKHKKRLESLAKKKKVKPSALYRQMLADYIQQHKNK